MQNVGPAARHRPGSRSSPRASTSGRSARDLKDQNFMAPFQLTCRRADNGEVVWQSTDLADYAAARPGRPADPGRRQALHRGQEPGKPPAAPGPAAAVRAGDPAARRQGALEDRGRHHFGKATATAGGTTAARPRPSRGWSTARGRSMSTPTSASSRGSTPIPACSTGAMAIRPTPFRASTGSSSGTDTCSRRSRRRPASPPLATGEAFLIKGMQSTGSTPSTRTG